MNAVDTLLETQCINTIRGLAIDAVQAANSGHPGMPMGAAPMAHTLWTRHLRHNPKNPKWLNRDRFVLSAGHGSMLLYSLLHLTGYDLNLEELKNFRQWGSKTPGHPENTLTPGVEMATGPLGQGFATAVGMAMAERFLSATYNRPGHNIVDHFTYGICSDGDLMEGISNEAASLAGHLGLGKLIFLYDDNAITIDGPTSIAFTEDVAGRFEALGWHVQAIDGMDVDQVDQALDAAKAETSRPSLICARTVIGYGSPNRAGTSKSHGEALGAEEAALAKAALGIPADPTFYISSEVLSFYRRSVERGADLEQDWNLRFAEYQSAFADQAASVLGSPAPNWTDLLPSDSKRVATRAASGEIINAIASAWPNLIGGSADLAGSNSTLQKNMGFFQQDSPAGKNICFGVREHGMAAIVNGITLHGACRAYGATFLQFADYCKASLRLSALMEFPSIFIFTHDSIGLGEDGPTHQPIEHLAGLRAIPNFNVVRPADFNETAAAWQMALSSSHTPTALILTRQAVAATGCTHEQALRGGYVVREATGSGPDLIIVATGSEVGLAIQSGEALEAKGVATRVVSLPSWFTFEQQGEAYQQSVLPKEVPTLSIEAGSTFGWAKYAAAHIGIDHFGASAPAEILFREFGFTVENVVAVADRLLGGHG